LNVQSLYALPYEEEKEEEKEEEEEEEEDTFIYQLWVHEGHEYSHGFFLKNMISSIRRFLHYLY
jgi:hypothetical protein